jgi:hypothetical protein
MLNAVNLTFVTFAKMLEDITGQVLVFFTLVVAAAEVAVGLAIIVAIFRRRRGATADDLDVLKGGWREISWTSWASCPCSRCSARRCCCCSASASASRRPDGSPPG